MDRNHVSTSGPLFDGRAERAVTDFCDDFAKTYADATNRELHNRFAQVFKHPTGRYESRVRVRRTGTGAAVVSGGGPYAAWLEGTSRRNQKSSFKGYGSFRLTAEKMERLADAAANAAFGARYLRRLG